MKFFLKSYLAALTMGLILTVASAPAWAAGDDGGRPDDFSPGFSGYVQPMVGAGYSKSLSDVSDKNERIDSLDQSAKSETDFIPMVLWNLGYTFDNAATRVFAGTPEENIIEGTFFLEVGISQKLGDGTVLTAAYIPTLPGLDDEVWRDPFLLGANRQETDRDSHAFRVSADSIFGSPFTIKYGFGKQDIENDDAGRYHAGLPGSTLTSRDLEALKRSGTFHQADLQYGFDLGSGVMVQPGIFYMKGNADGEANSFNRYGGQISMVRAAGRYQLFCTLSADYSDYDAVHPIFNQTRNQWEYGAILGVGYMAPFGWENFIFNVYTGVSKQEANINFYDSTGAMAGIGLTWMF